MEREKLVRQVFEARLLFSESMMYVHGVEDTEHLSHLLINFYFNVWLSPLELIRDVHPVDSSFFN